MITCCKKCKPPKRHLGCHAKCQEYLIEKARNDEQREWERNNKPHIITRYEYNEIIYADCKNHKHGKCNKNKSY